MTAETGPTRMRQTQPHHGASTRLEQLCRQACSSCTALLLLLPSLSCVWRQNCAASSQEHADFRPRTGGMLQLFCFFFFFKKNLSLWWNSVRSAVFHQLLLGATCLKPRRGASCCTYSSSVFKKLIDFFSDPNLSTVCFKDKRDY